MLGLFSGSLPLCVTLSSILCLSLSGRIKMLTCLQCSLLSIKNHKSCKMFITLDGLHILNSFCSMHLYRIEL